MSRDNFQEFIEQLKAKNSLTEVIGSYVKLERRGYNYWACCPFHHERTPSFVINASDGYYHCFGCGASGDVINFVKEYENTDFMTAVRILAARVKMEVPERDDRATEETARRKKLADRLSLLMKDAARFYLNNLYSGKAQAHLKYLDDRKVSPSVAKKFGLGASLDYKSLPAYLLQKGYTEEEMTESGTCSLVNGRLSDALGGRLIFPIINFLDEVVAFGGRVMEKTDRAKYKNTRETVIFTKSKNLYNINLVKKQKRAGGLPSLIMVEGYMDAISLYQAGFCNVVASMGTSLTKEQARLCRRYTENVFISYDGDFAGQKANLRGLDILKEEGVKVRVVPLPEGLDPDDVIKTSGAEGYQKCLDEAMPLIDFRLLAAKRKYDLTKTDEKRDYVKEALAVIKDAETNAEREELLKRLSREVNVSYDALQRDLDGAPLPTEQPPQKKQTSTGDRKAERFVLAACLFSKPYALDCDLNAIDFGDETLEKVAEYILRAREEGVPARAGGLFEELGGEESGEGKELSAILDISLSLDGADAERFFHDSVKALKNKKLRAQIEIFTNSLNEAQTREEKVEILSKIDKLTKQLKNS